MERIATENADQQLLTFEGTRLPRRWGALTADCVETQIAQWRNSANDLTSRLNELDRELKSLTQDVGDLLAARTDQAAAIAAGEPSKALAQELSVDRQRRETLRGQLRRAAHQRDLWIQLGALKQQEADATAQERLPAKTSVQLVCQSLAKQSVQGRNHPPRLASVRDALQDAATPRLFPGRKALTFCVLFGVIGVTLWTNDAFRTVPSRQGTGRENPQNGGSSGKLPDNVHGNRLSRTQAGPSLHIIQPISFEGSVSCTEPITIEAETRAGATGIQPTGLSLLVDGLPMKSTTAQASPSEDNIRKSWRFERDAGLYRLTFIVTSNLGRTEKETWLTVEPRNRRQFVTSISLGPYDTLPAAPSCADATRITELFDQTSGQWPVRPVRTDTPATSQEPGNLLPALADLSKRMTDKDIAVIYIGGHGQIDGGMLHFAQERNDRLTQLPAWRIAESLANTRGRVLILIDTCHASSFIQTVRKYQEDSSKLTSLCVLCASGEDEESEHNTDGSKFVDAVFSVARSNDLSPNVIATAANSRRENDSLEGARLSGEAISFVATDALCRDVISRVSQLTSGRQTAKAYQFGEPFRVSLRAR